MASIINAGVSTPGLIQSADASGVLQLQSNNVTGLTVGTNASITVNTSLNFSDGTTMSTTNSLGMRNRLINGIMLIDQRNIGASQTITAAAALAYTVDRWYAYCTGANVTGQRITSTGTTSSPSQRAYQFTGAASVTAIGFGQRIEASNCFDLAGTTATLSVNLSNSLLTSVTWTAYYANTADTFGTLASPTRTQIATGTFTVNSTLTRYSTQISIPAAATTGIEILFTVGAQTSGTWVIGNAQLEAGSVATPVERRLIPAELNLCQRYFAVFIGAAYQSIGLGVCASSTNLDIPLYLPSIMRTSPSLTVVGALSTFAVSDGASTLTPSAISIADSTGPNSNQVLLRVTGTFVASRPGRLYVNNNAASGLQLSSEL